MGSHINVYQSHQTTPATGLSEVKEGIICSGSSLTEETCATRMWGIVGLVRMMFRWVKPHLRCTCEVERHWALNRRSFRLLSPEAAPLLRGSFDWFS